MANDINNPAYWANRLRKAPASSPHHAVFVCPNDRWERIERKHEEILSRLISPTDSILDAGCGYGRLLNLLPGSWVGDYWGIDLSPDFIERARRLHPYRTFVVANLAELSKEFTLGDKSRFDWAIMISMRPMIRRELGEEKWLAVENNLRKFAVRGLCLEYDDTEEGEIIWNGEESL